MTNATITTADLVDSTSLLGSPKALQETARSQGYLFFRGLLPSEEVRQVRREALDVLDRRGWLKNLDGSLDAAEVGLIPDDEMRLDIGISQDGYVDIQKLEGIHRLPHHPNLLNVYAQLFEEPVLVHPRHIVRVMTSHNALHPTPAHQDFPLVQGSQNTWTAWFPLGDGPREIGPLAVLPGSHQGGYIPISRAEGAGNIEVQLCRGEDNWTSADFQAGDVLTFSDFTVHKAIPASDREHVRLSMDVRYQPASEPIEAKALRNHSDHDWAEIYEDWTSDSLKYYWRDDSPKFSPWDDSLLQPGRRIC